MIKLVFLKDSLKISVYRLLSLVQHVATPGLEAVHDVVVHVLQPDALGPVPAPVSVRLLRLPQLPLDDFLHIILIPSNTIIPPGVIIPGNKSAIAE